MLTRRHFLETHGGRRGNGLGRTGEEAEYSADSGGRSRLLRPGLLRRRNRDAEHRPAGVGRCAVHPAIQHCPMLSIARGAADRPASAQGRNGKHGGRTGARGLSGVYGPRQRVRAIPAGGAARQRVFNPDVRQVASRRPGSGCARLRRILRNAARLRQFLGFHASIPAFPPAVRLPGPRSRSMQPTRSRTMRWASSTPHASPPQSRGSCTWPTTRRIFRLHAPKDLIDKYQKVYEQGWDAIRDQRFARMQKLGLIDPRWKMSPRSVVGPNRVSDINGWAAKQNPAWETIPADRRIDLARRMAIFAAMVDRMDQNIGRVLSRCRGQGRTGQHADSFLFRQRRVRGVGSVGIRYQKRSRQCSPHRRAAQRNGPARHLSQLRVRMGEHLQHALAALQALHA